MITAQRIDRVITSLSHHFSELNAGIRDRVRLGFHRPLRDQTHQRRGEMDRFIIHHLNAMLQLASEAGANGLHYGYDSYQQKYTWSEIRRHEDSVDSLGLSPELTQRLLNAGLDTIGRCEYLAENALLMQFSDKEHNELHRQLAYFHFSFRR